MCTVVYTNKLIRCYGVVMSEMGIRQLRADAAASVRRAASGEHIVISIGGRPIAQLGPLGAPEGQARLSDLVARGLVIAPRRGGTYQPTPAVSVWSGGRIDKLLRDIR
jgi:antitoxin (DNA-binding transcriptional repressor) of toxin-antitoxin stability system